MALADDLEEAGLPEFAAVFAGEPTPDAPEPPDGPWVLVEHAGQVIVGGCSRGEFSAYEAFEDAESAVRQVIHLLTQPGSYRPVTYDSEECLQRGLFTAMKIHARATDRGGEPGPAELSRGDLLDALEPETADHLYPLGTPFEQRSLPPTMVDAPYRVYEVAESFDDHRGATEGVVAPWFELPGGGAMVVLDRPIRWYVDAGLLVELVDPPSA